nr:Transmembrane protein 19 [Polyrhizophydium stewartii]
MRAGDTTLFPTDERSDWVAFEYGAPGPDLLPTQLLAAAAQHRLSQPDAHTSLQYGPVLGDLRFRRELAAFLTRQYGRESNPVVAENLCITNGASQSFSNLITLFAGPDTTIYIENPTYFLAIRVLEDHGIPRSDLVAVPVDANGIRVDVLEQRLQQAKPAKHRQSPEQPAPHPKRFANVLYLVPTYSNPTGATLPLERRRALVKLAREHDMLVICDDIYQMLHFEEPLAEAGSVELPRGSLPPPRIVALDPALDPESSEFGNIVSNGSFSKLLAPELLIQVFLHNWDSPTLDLEGIESARHKLVWSYLSHDAVGQDLGQNLTSLVINQLQIRDALLIPALREMPRLAIFEARVNINFTAVSMAGVRHLLSLESLKTAKLGWINFSSHPLVAAMALQAPIAPLSNLKLRSTQICDKSLESLLSAMVSHEIETLDLMGTKIKSVGSLALLAPTLKKLNLSFCDLRMDHLLSALPKFQLAEFIMGGCKCFLLECPKLENLDLRHTGVNAESFLAALDEGSALPRLAQLDISSTAIGDNIAGFLVAVGSTLESCGLRFTQITASTVEIIAECCPRMNPLIVAAIVLWLGVNGVRKKSLSPSGAVAAMVLGAVVFSHPSRLFGVVLLAFYLSSSRLTKYKSDIKKLIEEDHLEGGQRNAVQVLSNGLTGMLACAAHWYVGTQPGAWPAYAQQALLYAYIGELGVLSTAQPILITTGRRVPRGTNGGISALGTGAAVAGGLFVGLAAFATRALESYLAGSLQLQFDLVLLGAASGFVGSMIDSLLGATLQRSVFNKNTKRITPDHRKLRPGESIGDFVSVSGIAVLDNHQVNFLSSLATAALAASAAAALA